MREKNKLTKKEALQIRKWRKKGTWRWVATQAANEWPERKLCPGNQIEGMFLCEDAAEVLKQNPRKRPWN